MTVIRHCKLTEAAGKYYEKKKRATAVPCSSKQKAGEFKEMTQQALLSEMLETLAAFEDIMGVDVETFLISKTS